MNVNPLKKGIIKESIIFGVAALFFAAVVFYVDSLHTDFSQKKSSLEGEVNGLLSQRQALESSFDAAKANTEAYKDALDRIANPGMFIDRQAVRDIFNIYRSQFFFKRLTVDMQPVTDVTDDPKYARKTLVTVKSDVKISFDGVSDDDVYALMRLLPTELAGYTKINKFEISKSGKIDEKTVLEIRANGSAALVSGAIEFTWYGMKSPDAGSELNKVVPVKKNDRRRRR